LTKDKLRRTAGKLGEKREENIRALSLGLYSLRNDDDDDGDVQCHCFLSISSICKLLEHFLDVPIK